MGRRVTAEYNLVVVNPNLAREWHPENNGKLTPYDVTPKSNKKVWWICPGGHEWQARVFHRTRGTDCPYCSEKVVCKDSSLLALNPILAGEWHPTDNGDLTPNDVSTICNTRVWWKCKNGHEWKATVKNRNKGKGCPYCSQLSTR